MALTAIYATLALWLRHAAQWLDPLPLEDAAQLALIESVRGDAARATARLEEQSQSSALELMHLRNDLTQAQNAFAALELEHEHCVPVAHDALYAKAVALTKEWATSAHSGEYKRHQVLASLIDAFPERPRSDMALAIEAALWR